MEKHLTLTHKDNYQEFVFAGPDSSILIDRVHVLFDPYPGNQGWTSFLFKSNLGILANCYDLNRNYQYPFISLNAYATPNHIQPVLGLNKTFQSRPSDGSPKGYSQCRLEMHLTPIEDMKISLLIIYKTLGGVTLIKKSSVTS
jgi:hypothetical protein